MDNCGPQWALLSQYQIQPSILLPTNILCQSALAVHFLVGESPLRCMLVRRINLRFHLSMRTSKFLLGAHLPQISKSPTGRPRRMSRCGKLAGGFTHHFQYDIGFRTARVAYLHSRTSENVEEAENRIACHLLTRFNVSLLNIQEYGTLHILLTSMIVRASWKSLVSLLYS